MKILPNLLTVDSDKANFPLHGGIYTFLYNPTNLKASIKAPCCAFAESGPSQYE